MCRLLPIFTTSNCQERATVNRTEHGIVGLVLGQELHGGHKEAEWDKHESVGINELCLNKRIAACATQ